MNNLKLAIRGLVGMLIVAIYIMVGTFAGGIGALFFNLISHEFSGMAVVWMMLVGAALGLIFGMQRAVKGQA